MNTISMKLQADELIRLALQEDISSEDVTTNSVMKEAVEGEVQLICKQDGIVAGLDVFKRVFELLDENTKTEFLCKDGDLSLIHIFLSDFICRTLLLINGTLSGKCSGKTPFIKELFLSYKLIETLSS